MSRNVWTPSIIALSAGLMIASAKGWSQDAWLLVRLKIAADDAFAMASSGYPILMMEDQEALHSYPPTRLAAFADFPDPRIRAVAFLSLNGREADHNPSRWVGVAPRLLASLLGDADEVVREIAGSVLLSMPIVPSEDAAAVVELIDQLPDGAALRVSMLAKLDVGDEGERADP